MNIYNLFPVALLTPEDGALIFSHNVWLSIPTEQTEPMKSRMESMFEADSRIPSSPFSHFLNNKGCDYKPESRDIFVMASNEGTLIGFQFTKTGCNIGDVAVKAEDGWVVYKVS